MQWLLKLGANLHDHESVKDTLAKRKSWSSAKKNIKNTLMYVQLAEELFRDQQEYVSKVAKTETDVCTLIDAGFEYVCDLEGSKIFRKNKY